MNHNAPNTSGLPTLLWSTHNAIKAAIFQGICRNPEVKCNTFFKTSSPLGVLTGYIGDTLYLTLTIYSIDCPSSLSSNHLDADLHFPITMLFNNRRKRTFARYQAVSVRCPVQMTSNPTGCHK